MMEENYKKWHDHTEQQLASHIQAAEDKAAADAEARRRRYATSWFIAACRSHALRACMRIDKTVHATCGRSCSHSIPTIAHIL